MILVEIQSSRCPANLSQTPVTQLGISAPQGCGKSTLVEQLEQLLAWRGFKAASVSIDDFYLDYRGQCALAEDNPGNKILQVRHVKGNDRQGI